MPPADLSTAISNAIGAHGAWKMRLRKAIATRASDLNPMEVRCDDRCEFGKWLYGADIDAATKAGMPYQVVQRLHAEFHQAAAEVIDAATHAQDDLAAALMEEDFTPKSDKLVRALTKWKREATEAMALSN